MERAGGIDVLAVQRVEKQRRRTAVLGAHTFGQAARDFLAGHTVRKTGQRPRRWKERAYDAPDPVCKVSASCAAHRSPVPHKRPRINARRRHAVARKENPVKAFVLDRCVVGPGQEIRADVLYGDWRVWCMGHGGDPGNKDWFGRNLRSAVPGLTTARLDEGGQRVLVYRGVGIEAPDHMGSAGYRSMQGARGGGGELGACS